jgi:hypothetical protein
MADPPETKEPGGYGTQPAADPAAPHPCAVDPIRVEGGGQRIEPLGAVTGAAADLQEHAARRRAREFRREYRHQDSGIDRVAVARVVPRDRTDVGQGDVGPAVHGLDLVCERIGGDYGTVRAPETAASVSV